MHKDIKRKNNVVLPDKQELTRILETEVVRDVPEEKESIHYPVFDTIVPLFEAYSIPTDIFLMIVLQLPMLLREVQYY